MTHSVSLLYFPVLHRSMLPPGLPEGALTCWPGLPRDVPDGSEDGKQGLFVPGFAWSPEEAKACLEDLRRLEPEANRAALALETEDESRKSGAEIRALDAFAGRRTEPLTQGPSLEVRRRAQRMLLTVWLQEERVAELRELADRYARDAASLARSLSEGEAGQAEEPDFLPDPSALLPPWRFVLEQMAVFLPSDVALCTADPAVIRDVGQRFGPDGGRRDARNGEPAGDVAVPGQAAFADELPPAWADRAGLTGIRIPLWRLLGHSRPASGRPWLNAERLIVLSELS